MEEAKGFIEGAWILVAVECLWRIRQCDPIATSQRSGASTFWPSFLFVGAYVLCIGTVWLELKKFEYFKAEKTLLRSLLKFLHACDGLVALFLGLSIYYQNMTLMSAMIVAMTKFFLLHLLSRMVTGVTAYTPMDISLQTTKTFLHHLGSFFFISDPTVSLITGFWRFVSMNGHAAMTVQKSISLETYRSIMWKISHARNLCVSLILLAMFFSPSIRRGFALSAAGHVSYMIVRLGPIFRLGGGGGSVYMSEEDNALWKSYTDGHRLAELSKGKHPWLSLELSLLFILCVVLLFLRVTTYGEMDSDDCTVN